MNFRIVSLPAMSLLFALVLSCGSSRSDEKRPPAAEQTKGEENASGDQKPDIVDDKGPTSGVNACGSGKAFPTEK